MGFDGGLMGSDPPHKIGIEDFFVVGIGGSPQHVVACFFWDYDLGTPLGYPHSARID